MLVLDIFPLWSDAGFEKVVIGFERELGGWSDVVLYRVLICDKCIGEEVIT